MFTDNPVTPVRLEILIETLRSCPRGLARKEVYRLLQPEPLNPDLGSGSPAAATVKAALELGLLEESGPELSLSTNCRKLKDTRAAILKAFDERVLANADVEKYCALFFAYYLGLGRQVYQRRTQNNQQWADRFNLDVFANEPQGNPFNDTKLRGLHRWYDYVGLGWYDPTDELPIRCFQANPYDRIKRTLPAIFDHKRKLDADDFMTQLAIACPELDGGALFLQANREWDATQKQCTLGLSHALVELHLDGVLRIACPADSTGWDLGEAEPPRNENFLSDRFASIQLHT
jgi:hypothetical protein